MQLAKTFQLTFAIAAISVMMLIVPFGLVHTQDAAAQPVQISNVDKQSPEEIEFKRLIDESYAALNALNSDALAKFYAEDADLVVYDIAPLKYEGWAEFKKGIQNNLFDNVTSFNISANDNLYATRKGNLAWTTFTWHLSAKFKDGHSLETDGRQTDIWERRNGVWLIVHEHTSAPLYP